MPVRGFIMQFRGNGRCAFGAAAALVGLGNSYEPCCWRLRCSLAKGVAMGCDFVQSKLSRVLTTAVMLLTLSGAGAEASPITYSLDISLPIGWSGAPSGGEVTGSITTDGTIGPLSISDILSRNLTITWNLTTGPVSAVLTATTSTVSDKFISGPCGYIGGTFTCFQAPPAPLSATAPSWPRAHLTVCRS
jgi:hypothetical protein